MVEVVVMKILIKVTMKAKDIMRTKVTIMTMKGRVKVTMPKMVIVKVAMKTMPDGDGGDGSPGAGEENGGATVTVRRG